MTFRRFLAPSTLAAVTLALYWLGCSAPRELAVVTERATVSPALPVASADSGSTVAQREASKPKQPASTVRRQSSVDIDNPAIQPGRFDGGKMWTFDDPPLGYFKEAYDFEPTSRWFDKARSGALRFSSYCSASFVSPNGLIMTNHHCARQSVTDVSKSGESLLDKGYSARSLELERKVKDLYVDQLVSTVDVTDEIAGAVRSGMSDDEQVQARADKVAAVAKRMTEQASTDSTFVVEVISLYNGGKYSAYTFRRYRDVRLVMAPELQIGFFGGDHDNFTYPRYNLDMSFFRAYGDDGNPLETPDFFAWSADGASEGEPVFVIGNPGSTSRLRTVSQLEFERDVALPQQLRVLKSRSQVLKAFIDANPEEADELDLRNVWFSLENSIKANVGQLNGLEGEILLPRKAAGEQILRDSIAASAKLHETYGSLFDDIEKMQRAKKAVADQSGAFTMFSSEVMSSHLLLRALYGYIHDLLKQRGAPEDRLDEMRKGGLAVKDWPAAVETGYIAARLSEMRDYLGASHPTVRSLLKGASPDSAAARLVRSSALADSAGFVALLDKGYLSSGDASVDVINSIASLYFSLGQQLSAFESREENLNAELARAQFAVFGTAIPPDASFSLRIADGVISNYAYNGTVAPVYTTFFGLYDRHFAFTGMDEWALPDRWKRVPEELDLTTAVNIISTNDITGGNSGSPLLNTNLEVVGLVFDSNIEALPNEYLYRDDAGRTISVDSRGIIEVLDTVYDMDRIVLELRTGTVVRTEEEADESQGL